MIVELLQKGIRTAYRALGARELDHRGNGVRLRGFRFPSKRERTLVFLHGLGDASTTWYRMVRDLADHARVLALDLPPFGISEIDEGFHLSPREQAARIGALIEGEAQGPIILVGQSMGGWVAQWLLHDRPELVDRAVLVSPGGAQLPGAWRTIDLLTPHTVEDTLRYLDALWHEPPPGVDLMARDMLKRLHSPEVRGFLGRIGDEDLLTPDQLASIRIPLWIVWGVQDGLLDPSTPAYLARHWGAPVQRSYLARSGHMPHQERPRATTARVLDALEHGVP